MHAEQHRCGLVLCMLWYVAWSVCLSVCHAREPCNGCNNLRHRLDCWLVSTQGTMYKMGVQIPNGKRKFWVKWGFLWMQLSGCNIVRQECIVGWRNILFGHPLMQSVSRYILSPWKICHLSDAAFWWISLGSHFVITMRRWMSVKMHGLRSQDVKLNLEVDQHFARYQIMLLLFERFFWQ